MSLATEPQNEIDSPANLPGRDAVGAMGWLLPFAIGAVALLVSWSLTWFLCDDAFIAFRYVGNFVDGHGLVWNPEPFAPVEGYSCFLWVVLLAGVQLVTGLEPNVTSNWLALAFALTTLLFVARALGATPMRLAGLALFGIGTSVTFATWASSGLETAMFGCFAVGWSLRALARGGLTGLAFFAALGALTRPDGQLLVFATLAIALHRALMIRPRRPRALLALWPLLLPLAHVIWRRAFYGEWVPNTYFAKVVAAWPESGARYLFGFVIEHGMWLWLPVVLGALLMTAFRVAAWRQLAVERFDAGVMVGTWTFFVGYYAFVVGGDHFAWRPFAHLIPLVFVAFVAALRQWSRWPRLAVAVLALFVVFGNAFGWAYDGALVGREKDGFVRARDVVGPLAPCFAAWDRDRAWLRLHYVGLPRGLHARTCEDLLALLPARRRGQVEELGDRRGVYRTVAAGVVGWALADVAIIDAVGLNDRVVARQPAPASELAIPAAALRSAFTAFDADGDGRLNAREIGALATRVELGRLTGVLVSPAAWGDLLLALSDGDGDDALMVQEFEAAVAELRDTRHMAHERAPPPGYIEALRPNVELRNGRFVVREDVEPLTDAEVRTVEARFWEQVRAR
ncbi:MAG: EF-hand domain-containing protein [bacterium]|nr:EF-hand domain-containing protein [bacterium]